ncbi:unnamed protein product [Didymodactylos carnosus]|uniref:Uncharacterized protein n=1 Tax=Didymodactylos carnosus TaxID=1234261 RepID=A0A814CND6_9BILA|nr:unnamed protein product [Didymodactylos carnosus]CAF1276557.1 unnamed protein product [Didymodactylos carnosus]CAF3721905.1 unnamed protein product [Didymodactylos carnosus]CAF4081612.1 unnamed protein product [Didymodactylos carnosus]
MEHHRVILPTNATSAANPLAKTIPTAISRDTVVEINREGEPPQYREIKQSEQILEPTELGATSIITQKPMTTTKTTSKSTVEEVPTGTTKTTVVTESAPVPEYVSKNVDEFKPIAVISDTTPVGSDNNRIVGQTATGSFTTPGKIVGDLEPVVAEHQVTTVVEPATKQVTKTVTTETT